MSAAFAPARPSSAAKRPARLSLAAQKELSWTAAYRVRPPSAGSPGAAKKERRLPWEPGKLDLWLERQPATVPVATRKAQSPRPSGVVRSASQSSQRHSSQRTAPRSSPQALRPTSSASNTRPGRRHNAWGANGPGDRADRSQPEKAEKAEPERRRSRGLSAQSAQSAQSASGEARRTCRPGPELKTFSRDAWAVKSTDQTALETEGIWWEWQWWGAGGWSFFSACVTEQIEKAFALGRASCSLLYEGRQVEFNLADGKEVNGESRIRRIRMPCDESSLGASVCSTFLASTLSDQLGPSLWTNTLHGDSKLLSVDHPEPSLLSPSRTNSIVVEPSISAGFSSDWFADASARSHKPGRHGSRVKHRTVSSMESHVTASVSLKDITSQPLQPVTSPESPKPDHHVWRSEAYEALNRAGRLQEQCAAVLTS